ncbi:MAG TPA: type II secretion system protein N [Noviherbaspirillum sp.]
MKRLPLVASFLLFIVLCASAAYWGMQLFKPPLRPVAAPPRVAPAEIRTEPAAALFGGRSADVAVASNYQLKGVIFSGNPRDSVAIISADGNPPQAVRVNAEIMPGVTVKEVHRGYVLLSEGGATKRVELPEDSPGQENMSFAPTAPSQPAATAQRPPVSPRAQAFPPPQMPPPPPPPPQPVTAQPQAPVPGQVPGTATQVPNTVPGQVPGAFTGQPGQPADQVPGQTPPQIPGQPQMTAPPPTVVVSPPPSAQPGNVPQAPPATAVPQPVPGTQTVPGTQPPAPGVPVTR